MNWYSDLPDTAFSEFMTGAILLVRKSLFNQAPLVSPLQTTSLTESAQNGVIEGSLEVIDIEGDPYEFSVVRGPTKGVVSVSLDGSYVYTTNGAAITSDFSDQFTVTMAPSVRTFNLLDPFSDRNREFTVFVGAQSYTNPFETPDREARFNTIDTAAILPDVAASLNLQKGRFGKVNATVSLAGITPDTALVWMNAKGKTGNVSIADLTSRYWDRFTTAAKNGGDGVTLALDFQTDDGTDQTVILSNVAVKQTSPGQYEFSGTLAPDPQGTAVLNQWDVLGTDYKQRYESFLNEYVDVPNFKPLTLDLSQADLVLDSYSPASYRSDTYGIDPGMSYAEAVGDAPATMTTGAGPDAIMSALSTNIPVVPTYNRAVTVANWSPDAVTVMMPQKLDGLNSLLIGDGIGRVRFGGLTPGWNTLQGPGWQGAVTAAMPYSDGFVLGLRTGAVEQWTGKGFTELQGTGWKSAVSAIMPYQSGFIVGLANGSIQQWTGTKFQELMGTGWASSANTLTPYGDGFVVGLQSGAVERWTGTRFEEMHDTGWAGVNVAMPYQSGFVLGLDDSSIQQWTGTKWQELIGSGWASSANTLTPYGNGFVVGLQSGAVERWTGTGFTELHDTSWGAVTVSAPYQSGFVVGLDDGSIQKWNGTAFEELHGNWGSATTGLVNLGGDRLAVSQNNGSVQLWDGTQWKDLDTDRVTLSEETLKLAVAYASDGGQAMGAGDPLFNQAKFQPNCAQSNKCTGRFYKFQISKDTSLASKEFQLGTSAQQSITLSYDVGTVTYGYAYVPDGIIDKLRPSQYAFAAILALPTGPSVTLDLAGEAGKLDWGGKLWSGQLFYAPTVVGTFGVDAAIGAGINVNLGLPDGFTDDELSAHAYFVPGFLLALNTGGDSGVETGYNYYPDIDFTDFTSLQSLSVGPYLEPSLTAKWGLFTPKPIDLTLFALSIGYKNPVSFIATVAKGKPPEFKVTSEGIMTYGAKVIPDITSALTYEDEFTIYDAEIIL